MKWVRYYITKCLIELKYRLKQVWCLIKIIFRKPGTVFTIGEKRVSRFKFTYEVLKFIRTL